MLAHWLRNHEDSHHTKPVLSENNSAQICAPACPLCPWKSSRREPAQAPAVHTDLTRARPSLSQARVKHSHCPALHRLCTCFPLTDLTLWAVKGSNEECRGFIVYLADLLWDVAQYRWFIRAVKWSWSLQGSRALLVSKSHDNPKNKTSNYWLLVSAKTDDYTLKCV